MLTTVWGPSLWHTLHTISFNYPLHPSAQEKRSYREFMYSLKNVLPCRKCRENLSIYYGEKPLTAKCLSSRKNFSVYVYNMHERVNRLLRKNSKLSYCDVRERYEHFRARCADSNPTSTIRRQESATNSCTESLHGAKSKCVLSIVPASKRCKTLSIHSSCLKRRRKTRRTR